MNRIKGRTLMNRIKGRTLMNRIKGRTLMNRIKGRTLMNRIKGRTLMNRSKPAGLERATSFAIVDPVLLDQVVAVTEFHVGPGARSCRVSLPECSGTLVRVFQVKLVKPAAAQGVGDNLIKQVGDRRSHPIGAKVSIRCRQTTAVNSDELRRSYGRTANGIADESIHKVRSEEHPTAVMRLGSSVAKTSRGRTH